MNGGTGTLVVNTSFPELNHLAASLAEAELLSQYVRPYVYFGRGWEKAIEQLPMFGSVYARSFGRRKLPPPLAAEHLNQVGLVWDFAMAAGLRVPIRGAWYNDLRRLLMYRVTKAVARAGARAFRNERAVVATWGCALPAFEKATQIGAIRILNYSLAHHAFTRRYLLEEAKCEPGFASTLNSHDLPSWQTEQLDREIELADHILVGSSFAKESFVTEGVSQSKLCVIPYGADTSLFVPPVECRPAERFNVLFVGQLTQRKGISYLLRAYERFHGPDTTLTMVGQLQGDGTALQPWRHLIRYVPHVSRPHLAGIFHQADVFVFPTLVEGMPLAVLEAMASGLPVITTPNGPGDIVRDSIDGFVVPPRDVDALVDRLERLRADSDLRIQMGRSARQRAQEYAWSAYRKRITVQIKDWVQLASRSASTRQGDGVF